MGNYGLVDHRNTSFYLTVTSEYRDRSITGPVYSSDGRLNCRYAAYPWCNWCWIRLHNKPARHVSITLQTEDSRGWLPCASHQIYEQRKADAGRSCRGENWMALTYAYDFIYTQTMDIYLCWAVEATELDEWNQRWETSPVEGGDYIPTGNGVFTRLWRNPGQSWKTWPKVKLFLVGEWEVATVEGVGFNA